MIYIDKGHGMTLDYKSTIFLPQTTFQMKANLLEREPQILAQWKQMNLYQKLRQHSKGKPLFIVHDGPPYANGHLHMGTALNKVLKDIVCKSKFMLGFDTPFIPGWDCHGLPIEAKVEENYRQKGLSKDQVPVIAFRQECRDYASKWIKIQSEEFQRLGCFGEWNAPYATMDFSSEAAIVRELGKFLFNGGLFLGTKPIMWSVVEKTALAEAEIEYHDKTSRSIYLGFKVASSSHEALQNAIVVIWTTTPWTIPGNRAIAFHDDVTYSLVELGDQRYLLAQSLVEAFSHKTKMETLTEIATFRGNELAGTICAHPLRGQGYDFDVPLFAGTHVTTDAGTGFVHTAPGHGVEDFAMGKKYHIEIPYTVENDGLYAPGVPLFAGTHVFKANDHVLPKLRETGLLLFEEDIIHSYPHSWRSKAPLIFRTTPQWFISMDATELRQKSLQAIQKVQWFPKNSINRIHSMVESRPDWCISRQRAWGTPITLFIHKKSREILKDPELFERIAQAIETEGSDIWFNDPGSRFLPPKYNPEDYEQVPDILDVWFDAGSTHSFVLEQREGLKWPASLYLEGTDQHRGWFQSSLLIACGTRGQAPYENVITHGFVVDEHGKKMSKSLGNTINLEDLVKSHGVDLIRLWIASSDYMDDIRIGKSIIKQQEDVYRRFRNTFRYLLGSLNDNPNQPTVAYDELPDLEKWVLHRLACLDELLKECLASFEYNRLIGELNAFCSSDLSAFYFDIRKDSLYCDHSNNIKRKSTLYVMNQVFDCLVKWLAPFLCFTAEEAWMALHGQHSSVHEQLFLNVPGSWKNSSIAEVVNRMRNLRRVMTGALEVARANHLIGSSLQAALVVGCNPLLLEGLENVDWAELAIASHVSFVEPHSIAQNQDVFCLEDFPSAVALVQKAEGDKCQRCWKILPEVVEHPEKLCARCDEVVNA